jgi:uncharacterized protein (TIGR02246 family)
MSHRRFSGTSFAIVLSIVLAPAFLSARAASSESAADSAAIKELVMAFTNDFNRHDAQAVATHFTEDADFTNVQGMTTHSRKGIEEHFVPLFKGRLANAHRTVSVRGIHPLSPTIAAVTTDYELKGAKDTSGADQGLRKGIYDWVVVKQNGRWMIAVFHESDLPSPAALVPVH